MARHERALTAARDYMTEALRRIDDATDAIEKLRAQVVRLGGTPDA